MGVWIGELFKKANWLAFLATTLAVGLVPCASFAQGIIGLSPQAPPAYSTRQFGINLSTSDVQLQNDDISVGSGEFPVKLTLTRTYNAVGYPFMNLRRMQRQNQFTGFGQGSTHNLIAYFTGLRCGDNNNRFIQLNAVVFGKSYNFSGGGCSQSGPSAFISNNEDGSTMRIVDPFASSLDFELVTPDGVKVLFTDRHGYSYDTIKGRYATYAEFPNGDFIGFNYEPSPTISGTVRLSKVYNSRGYGLLFSYKSRPAYFTSSSLVFTLSDSSLITSVTSFKQTASGMSNISTVNYEYDSADYVVETFRDVSGESIRYKYDQGRPLELFFQNNESFYPSIRFSYHNGVSQVTSITTSNVYGTIYRLGGIPGLFYPLTGVSDSVVDVQWSAPASVTDAMGNVTRFEFSDVTAPDPISAAVREPDGATRWYGTFFCPDNQVFCQLDPYYVRNPTHVNDGTGNFWRFRYDSHGRLVSTEMPDGILRSQTRDLNGNIIESRVKARPGSGLPDLVATAGYPQCNGQNYRHCNKPSFTIDPAGGRWNYEYSSQSGQLIASLAPADGSGVRAVTRYHYTSAAYAAVPLPYLFQGSSLTLLAAVDTCLSSPITGTTVDFSYACGAGNRSRITYGYIPSTASSPSSSELQTVVSDADQAASSTSFGYDVVGNVVSVVDPLNNNSFTTYDSHRRVVFEIGPDPDGSGAAKRQITRHWYDDNGNEIRTEVGIGDQIDGSDFAVLQVKRNTYDLNDRLVKSEEVVP